MTKNKFACLNLKFLGKTDYFKSFDDLKFEQEFYRLSFDKKQKKQKTGWI